MAPVKSFLVAAFCAALVCASAARELQTTYTYTPCVSYMGGTVSSTSGVAFKSTFTKAFDDCIKTFCETTPCESTCSQDLTPTNRILAEALAVARPALATATAQAMTEVMSKGFVAGDCSGFVSKVSAKAKAQTMAKAVSSSFASAFASVVGQQSYSAVYANISVQTTALQAACEKEFIAINPSSTYCRKTNTKCTEGNIGRLRWGQLTSKQQDSCYIVTCCFAEPTEDQITTTVTTSARAIAQAASTVTVTQSGAGRTCTYEGQLRQCREFTTLCNAQCDGLEECLEPVAEDFCSETDQGDWEELPNHDWQCQPLCDEGLSPRPVCETNEPCESGDCTQVSCEWECAACGQNEKAWAKLPNGEWQCQPSCAVGLAPQPVCDAPCDNDDCPGVPCEWECCPVEEEPTAK